MYNMYMLFVVLLPRPFPLAGIKYVKIKILFYFYFVSSLHLIKCFSRFESRTFFSLGLKHQKWKI